MKTYLRTIFCVSLINHYWLTLSGFRDLPHPASEDDADNDELV